MGKKNKIKAAQIMTVISLLVAGAVLYHLFTAVYENFELGGIGEQGTRLEFNVDHPAGIGFHRNATVYTGNGITSVTFSGKITVDGTTEIIVTANEDDSLVYSETYSNLEGKTINFEVDGLAPYAYYTLSFTSKDAKNGYLLLTTNESLVERPEPPARPEHTVKIG